LKKKRRPIRVL